MRIHVARLDAERARHIDVDGGPFGVAEVLLVGIPRFGELFDLDRKLHEPRRQWKVYPEAIVLRAHPHEAKRLLGIGTTMQASAIKDLAERTKASIYVLHFSEGQHRLDHAAGDVDIHVRLGNQHIPALRRAEFNFFATDPGALLPASETFHYVGPNNHHYDSFLRAGSAVQSPEELDAAAFWLLPHITEDTFVVVETSTISVVGLHLKQYLEEEELTADRSVGSTQALGGYENDAIREFINRSAKVIRQAKKPFSRALVVFSVLSTGDMAARTRAAVFDLGFETVDVVALFGTADSKAIAEGFAEVFCELPTDLGRATADDCERCKPDSRRYSPALQISPTTFTVGVAESVVPTRLDKPYVADVKDLVARYRGMDVFSVHRTDDSNDRHHAVHVDVGAMLFSPIFQDRYAAKLDELKGEVDVILHPSHTAARELAQLARQQLGVQVVEASPGYIGDLDDEGRAALSVGRLLIIDDAIVTGDRIRSYRNSLLKAGIEHQECHALVGLMRLQNEDERQGLANILHQMGRTERNLHAVEECFLPNWQEQDCPWCWESDLLAGQVDPGAEVVERFKRIDGTKGLVDGLFWGWSDDEFPLGPGSVFGPKDLNQAEIFTVIASGLQTMRSRQMLDEEFTPPVSKVLKAEFWTSGRFYVDVIVAAILRAARAHDLQAPKPGRSYMQAADRRLVGQGDSNLRTEILLAMAANKMPVTRSAIEILTSEEADEGVAALFSRVLDLESRLADV